MLPPPAERFHPHAYLRVTTGAGAVHTVSGEAHAHSGRRTAMAALRSHPRCAPPRPAGRMDHRPDRLRTHRRAACLVLARVPGSWRYGAVGQHDPASWRRHRSGHLELPQHGLHGGQHRGGHLRGDWLTVRGATAAWNGPDPCHIVQRREPGVRWDRPASPANRYLPIRGVHWSGHPAWAWPDRRQHSRRPFHARIWGGS